MPAEPINALAARVLADQGAQADLPRTTADPGSFLDRWTLSLPDVVLYIILAACAALLIYIAVRLRRGPVEWAVPNEGAQHAGPGETAHLAAADAFAAAGRLREALHELLLQALADVRRQSGGRLDPSLTSREILRDGRLAPAAQDVLAGIVSEVEWTYFGLRPASLAAWEECRTLYNRLNTALGAAA